MARDADEVRVRRVYEAPDAADGTRVLVDRLWPRGLSKAAAELDAWDKDVAPSAELRRWYGHDPARFDEFAERYRAELAAEDGERAVRELCERAGSGRLTLLTATKDVEHGHVLVLADVVRTVRRG
ncbi:DUF488 family protein [Streptomyces sp. NPDC050617]|uniref:DUF488 domain-containing protein n=1 Tax=Streptomyces sp. NPDC050617 TaxID=3154628 RepID=UPI00343B9834